jgi:hypothetical protein
VQSPANDDLAVPGYYMLFLVNKSGVPSIAPMVRLPAPYEDTQPPTAPTNLTATGGVGNVQLTWTASTDSVGVTQYNIYRSTVSGFTPSSSTLIGTSATTSYTDTVAPGIYYYLVTAQNAVDHVSQPSNQASATSLSAIRLIQDATNGSESSLAQLSVAFPSANTAGDFLIVTGTAARPRSTLTISDTAGDAFVSALDPVSDPSQDVTAYIWYVANAKGVPNTVTDQAGVANGGGRARATALNNPGGFGLLAMLARVSNNPARSALSPTGHPVRRQRGPVRLLLTGNHPTRDRRGDERMSHRPGGEQRGLGTAFCQPAKLQQDVASLAASERHNRHGGPWSTRPRGRLVGPAAHGHQAREALADRRVRGEPRQGQPLGQEVEPLFLLQPRRHPGQRLDDRALHGRAAGPREPKRERRNGPAPELHQRGEGLSLGRAGAAQEVHEPIDPPPDSASSRKSRPGC